MQIIYNHDRKAFLVNEGDEELACVDFNFSDLDHNGNILTMEEASNYTYAEYYKKDVKELAYRITNVNVGEGGGAPQRVGWILPIAMLTTEDEDTLGQEHVNQYVFFAYCYLLGKEAIVDEVINGKELDEILTETYPDGCLLIVNNTRMPEGVTLKRLELSLARNGYFLKPTEYANPLISEDGNLNLTPALEILKSDNSYVDNYLDTYLRWHVYNPNPFIRFFYLYQLVEVLLDMEMIAILKDFIYLLENSKTSYRTAETALQKHTESERFFRIVQNSGLKVADYAAFDNLCYTFLNWCEDEEKKPNPESIYQVRNHIVHRFRKAASDEATVKSICDHLELYLYDLLICYKLPKVNRPTPAS